MSGVESGEQGPSGTARAQPARAGWPNLGDLWPGTGTSGAPSGTSGWSWRGYLSGLVAMALMVAAFNIVNVTSDIHDIPGINPIEPIIWEVSSWITFTLFVVIPWTALRLAPFSVRPRWLLPVVHIPALLLFSFLHVAGFIAIRKAVYAAFGAHYSVGVFADFWYEFRKDTLSYTLSLLVFWTVERQWLRNAVSSPMPEGTYDIRDGARLIRVPVADILAVTSAGNYVEFVLDDGRRPLMRSPLSALETELGPRGFVRTHRSWLVNAGRVTGLAPEGSGDYRVEMGDMAVPLSRRYRAALAALRSGG